jgi:hypothetical protein
MFTGERLREIVVAHIERNERLGYQAGGSGHLGYVSFEVDKIGEPTRIGSGEGEVWEVAYSYTLFVETEFTYYPDNPPHEYRKSATVLIDHYGNILDKR